jgi:capsular exopolysaccharide synthesis family protein
MGEGKSSVVANLAVAEAQARQRVVLVDADFRRPTLHKIFGLSNYRGFSQALSQEHNAISLLRTTEFEGLKVLTSGPPPSSPDAALDPRKVKKVLSDLAEVFDLVLFDGPPALLVADTSLIAPIFDGVLIVARYGETDPKDLRHVITQFQGINVSIAGTVLNGFQPGRISRSYKGAYYESSSPAAGVN